MEAWNPSRRKSEQGQSFQNAGVATKLLYVVPAGTACRVKSCGSGDWRDHVTRNECEFDSEYKHRTHGAGRCFFRGGSLLWVEDEKVIKRRVPIGKK
jgi:hypothetical protein